MAAESKQYYELYRRGSLGVALTDAIDELITERRMEPQLAMKILSNFDKAFTDVVSEKVKQRMSFKGHLDTYRFCDEVWTFILKDVNVKLDNSQNIQVDKIRIVSCNAKKPGCACCQDGLIKRYGKTRGTAIWRSRNSVRSQGLPDDDDGPSKKKRKRDSKQGLSVLQQEPYVEREPHVKHDSLSP